MSTSSKPEVGHLFRELSADLTSLASHTVALARLEVSNTVATISWSAVGILAGLVIAFGGFSVLVTALVLVAIALGLPPWAAALLVGIALMAGGAGTVVYFVNNLRHAQLTLKETRDSLKETMEWLKHEAVG